MSNTDKRTATQRIEDLEKVVTMLYQATAQMKSSTENLMRTQGDMVLVKDALKLLNKKTEAIIQTASPETGITVSSVSELVVKMNVEDLTAQVAAYVENGHLVSAEEVSEKSYLVCEELNADGSLANPRIQFRLDSQDEATATSLKGKRAGDVVSFGENKFSAKILEVYSVVEPKSEEAAPVAPAAEASVQSAASPAPEVPSVAESPVPVFVPSEGMMTAS